MSTIDGFVKIKFTYTFDEGYEDQIESMWATPCGLNYKLENIPFYVKEFALGDVICTKTCDGELYVDDLVEESGSSTIQIVFFEKTIVQKTRQELKVLGCDSEISDKPHLIAVDVPKSVNYKNSIVPYLENGFRQDLWDYQEACLSSVHSG
ncbi:DUF4265 domain-containing protein [Pedobacter nutrimenti]|uniref:DUF4265 domain-containing protein n=1 Tax=Pedobacter nutrimenti TaxID=1241337 RepID=UPI00292FDED2|nr:DUF4265 domain-containing protein [Pedobacter nutrimenti]